MKKFLSLVLLFNILFYNVFPISAYSNTYYPERKFPSINEIFLNSDKYEEINRKIFNFNLKMNRIFAKKIHIIWASIFPEFIINALNNAYSNIEYPKRLVSCLLQKDMDAARHETKRFMVNTTLGAVGFIDFAAKFLNLELYDEDMEQACAKCKMKHGFFVVLPFISSTTTRDITGRIFDFLLTPTTYIASPIAAAVKLGLLINRTLYIQPLVKMVESNFCDSYDISRKFFGLEKYIKLSNLDRTSVLENFKNTDDEIELVDKKKDELIKTNLQVTGKLEIEKAETLVLNDDRELKADIILKDYNPQYPVIDSMRTALFDFRENKNSIWSETSLWKRDFKKKLRYAQIELYPNREKYLFKYVLQKNKTAPLAIIMPSIGEGIESSHSAILAKMFYDEGYSALILGSHFQWEFSKSIPKGYKLGIIQDDVKYIDLLINKSIDYLSKKYDRTFIKRVAIGTSLGAYATIFLGAKQYFDGGKNIDKFIAISPPYEMLYATEEIDKIIAAWKKYPDNFAQKIATAGAKTMKLYKQKEKFAKNFKTLPFSISEAKLLSAFLFHQKLSDLIYAYKTDENKNINKKELYDLIYSYDYSDYIKNYLLINHSYNELKQMTSMKTISDYLINSNDYKIFHGFDDYLINKNQLQELKSYCEDKLTVLSNGAHLGFLYRDEFIKSLKEEIKIR